MAIDEQEWQTLDALREGAIFVTKNGIYAVKSEYTYPNHNAQCILLIKQGNMELVREVFLGQEQEAREELAELRTRFRDVCKERDEQIA